MSGEVRLRKVSEDDLPTFFTHQQDAEAAQMAGFPPRDWAGFNAHWARILVDATLLKQTILYEEQVVGNIVCYGPSGEREIGYWLGREFWGRGIATQALALFLEQVKTRPLYAHVAKHNIASLRVLQKCGFHITGEDRWSPTPGGAEIEEYILKLDADNDIKQEDVS